MSKARARELLESWRLMEKDKVPFAIADHFIMVDTILQELAAPDEGEMPNWKDRWADAERRYMDKAHQLQEALGHLRAVCKLESTATEVWEARAFLKSKETP